MKSTLEAPAVTPSHWLLDQRVSFLNHGSFGSCPRAVLAAQRRCRDRLERQPITFFARELEAQLDAARAALAQFVGAAERDLVFVPNATTGINAVLRSLRFRPGDELLTTSHEYNACRNALEFAASSARARVIVADLPFPLCDEAVVFERVLDRVTRRTRLVLIDHVTSQTALVLPLERLIPELQRRGALVLVDGAHAPGMLPLDLAALNADFYTGNCHKWICAPKGAGFLWVRSDRQKTIRPTVISHGANSARRDRSRFLIEFGWTGTHDPTPWLCVPSALEFMAGLLRGGWPAIMARNRALALAARQILGRALGQGPPCPESLVGSMAAIALPDDPTPRGPESPLYLDPLQERLFGEFRFEVPVVPWPNPPHRLLRLSAQLYNHLGEYRRLAAALLELLGGRRK